jgi:hypothetical protein
MSLATLAVVAPIPAATAAGHLPGLAPCRDGRMALADADRTRAVSYPELDRTVRAAAAGLARRGVRSGDVVGLRVADAVSFTIGSLAVRACGAVPFPVSAGAGAAEAAAQLAGHDVRVLLASASLASVAIGLAERSRVRQVICFGSALGRAPRGTQDGTLPGTMPFAGLLEHGTMRPLPRDGADPALLCYPSGPGGRGPAWVTYELLAADLRRLAAEAPMSGWDVVIAAPPRGDGSRYAALLDLALAQGATVIAAPSSEPGDLLAVARRELATAAIVPASADVPRDGSLRVFTVPSDQ